MFLAFCLGLLWRVWSLHSRYGEGMTTVSAGAITDSGVFSYRPPANRAGPVEPIGRTGLLAYWSMSPMQGTRALAWQLRRYSVIEQTVRQLTATVQ